ncbi:hypothetical protein OSTOST_07373 [Ostertagia ostertagi]
MAHRKAFDLLRCGRPCIYAIRRQQKVLNANDVLLELFLISEKDSRYMEDLMEKHTADGVLDRERYNEALRQLHPRLHMTMEDFRKTYRDIESQDQAAKRFIDDLLVIARKSRDGEIKRHLETRKILHSFCGLKKRSQDVLKDKLQELNLILKCDQVPPDEESFTTTTPKTDGRTTETATTEESGDWDSIY